MPNARMKADAVVEHLLLRSGVLREPVRGRIDFVHRTVQEYLTAKQFADDGDLEPLIAQAHKDQWSETTIMAAGHANAPQRKKLLTGLLSRIDEEPRNARRLKLLVAGCLETLTTIPIELRQAVEDCVDGLIPPRDLASARSLSNVGEPILDRLPPTPDGLTPAAARAVVRTAWLINGPRALDLLSGYSGDPRQIVQEELIKGWEYFDPDLYARRVLADAPLAHGHLTVPTPRLLSAVQHLTHLRSITATGPVPDLSFLRHVDQPLKLLFVKDLQSGDLSPLVSHAETLKYLYIFSDVVEDFTPLLSLQKLREFHLDAAGITDLSFLRRLPQLKSLDIAKLNKVRDLSPLRAHASLEFLRVADSPGLTNWGVLPPLGDVTELWLVRSSLASTLSDLVEQAPKLRSLRFIHSSWVGDLAPLTSLHLNRLGLWGCRGITDFAPLGQLTELTDLDLEDTNICELSPLAGLAKLETLWLRHCTDIVDLSPLAALPNLRKLYIWGVAPGVDLAPLADNRRLTVYIDHDQDVRNRGLLKGKIHAG
jgi:hypothetical protein